MLDGTNQCSGEEMLACLEWARAGSFSKPPMPRRKLLRSVAATTDARSFAHPCSLFTVLVSLAAGVVACAGKDEPPLASGGTSGSAAGSSSAGSGGSSAGASAGAGGTGGVGGTSGGSGGSGGMSDSGGMSGSAAIEPSFNMLKSVIQTSCFGGLCHDLPENPLKLTINDQLYTTLTTH